MEPDEKPILERIEKVLDELSRSIARHEFDGDPARPMHVAPQTSVHRDSHPGNGNQFPDRLTVAMSLIRARKARDDIFGGDLFFDPAWNILLELYLHRRQRTAVSITSLCAAADVSSSTGLRWVTLLERRGLIAREFDPFDRRKTYAILTEEAVRRLEQALDGAVDVARQSKDWLGGAG